MLACNKSLICAFCVAAAFEVVAVLALGTEAAPDAASVSERRSVAAIPSGADPEYTNLRCHEHSAMGSRKLVIGVKTTRFYHATRAMALWQAWGKGVAHGLTFASDGPLLEAAAWPASVVVVTDAIDSRRGEAYVPPWRDSSVDADDIDPFALPQLTRRVAALVEAMYSCWGAIADWFLVVDDDTFVRPSLLESALADLDPNAIHLLGVPTSSDRFALPSHQKQYGASVHCGGSSVILSRALVERLVKYTDQCLAGPPRTTLAWYWDEVELLGRCLYELLGVNCSSPPSFPVARGEVDLPLNVALKSASDLQALEDYVAKSLHGNWTRLPFATMHPIEAPAMRALGARFRAGTMATHQVEL